MENSNVYKKGWVKIENEDYKDYDGEIYQITNYWKPNIILENKEFYLYGFVNNTLGSNTVAFQAKDMDYSKPGGGNYTEAGLIAANFGPGRFDYAWHCIKGILEEGGGYGVHESHAHHNEETNKMEFYFGFEPENKATLTYANAILLHQIYFNTMKEFIEDFFPKYMKEEWYKKFVVELEKLNAMKVE